MFTDTYYRFESKEQADSVLSANNLAFEDENSQLYYGKDNHLVDIVGKVLETPGTYDEEGNVITAPVLADGWHVNIRSRGDKPEGLTDYEIFPETPTRGWAS